MMRITKVLFRWTLPIAASITFLASLLNGCDIQRSQSSQFAALSLAATLANSLVILVPRALKAGAKATTKTSDSSKAATDFSVSGGDGSGKSVTRTLHQTVVVFVAVALVGAVGYLHFAVKEGC